MEFYTSLSDEKLHELVVSGDSAAVEVLILRCTRMVRAIARQYFLAGGDNEDLLQEGMIGLLSAIRDYKEEQNSSFRAYAEICIRRRILSAIRAASRKKHAPLNEGVSFEEAFDDEAQAQIVSEISNSPEELVLAKESAEEFIRSISQLLSAFEQKVLNLYLDGYTYQEIAELLSKSGKSIDNAVQRIRQKLARTTNFSDNSES